MKIRQERPSDYEEVYKLVKLAFETSSHSDGTEQDYLNDVRKRETFLPELSLVAENKEGEIIGQIVLYEIILPSPEKAIRELLLSPISVHPNYQRQGVARALIERSFGLAKERGYKAVFICGDPQFYNRFGFVPTYEFNIYHVTEKDAKWCMAVELVKGALENVSGTIDIQ
jgi:predicted N-acetyltransferase YhbS